MARLTPAELRRAWGWVPGRARGRQEKEKEMSKNGQQFDPKSYLVKLKGKDYLEVKWRLVWLRTDMPEASIETEHVILDSTIAVFRARVTLPNGASASGYGSQTPAGFVDYIEKAETKAIGRALNALGYGTQFTDDFELDPGRGEVADSPLSRPKPAPPASRELAGKPGPKPATAAPGSKGEKPSMAAITRFWSAVSDAGCTSEMVLTICRQFGFDNPGEMQPSVLDRLQATLLAGQWKQNQETGRWELDTPPTEAAGTAEAATTEAASHA